MSVTVLQRELEFFEQQRNALYAIAPEKFAVILGAECRGFYDTEADAFAAGVSQFGFGPFLIKQVLLQDPVEEMHSYLLGLIHATV